MLQKCLFKCSTSKKQAQCKWVLFHDLNDYVDVDSNPVQTPQAQYFLPPLTASSFYQPISIDQRFRLVQAFDGQTLLAACFFEPCQHCHHHQYPYHHRVCHNCHHSDKKVYLTPPAPLSNTVKHSGQWWPIWKLMLLAFN